MATQVDSASAQITAETVGNAFVQQFYNLLHEKPEMVHKFFTDSSTMSRPGRDGTLATVTSMEGINDLILSSDCQGYRTEILTADAQDSYMDGVIVLVTGCLTGSDIVRRKFTETFFLAPQEKEKGSHFYVLNNAFRFIEDSGSSLPIADPLEEVINPVESVPAATLTSVQDTVEVPDSSSQRPAVVAEVAAGNSVEGGKDSGDKKQQSVANGTAVTQTAAELSQNPQPVVEASSNGHVDAPKKSYALALLKDSKEGASATLVRTPVKVAQQAASPAKVAAPKVAQQPAATPAGRQSHSGGVAAKDTESSVSNGRNGAARGSDLIDEKGHSIYIGDLPRNATAELVEQEFKKFGRIKRNGVQVRSHHSNKEYCFGFVEYEDASGKQKAVEMGSILIGDKEAFFKRREQVLESKME